MRHRTEQSDASPVIYIFAVVIDCSMSAIGHALSVLVCMSAYSSVREDAAGTAPAPSLRTRFTISLTPMTTSGTSSAI
jgi:hypothetical protein